jgi:hypothetical protein
MLVAVFPCLFSGMTAASTGRTVLWQYIQGLSTPSLLQVCSDCAYVGLHPVCCGMYVDSCEAGG